MAATASSLPIPTFLGEFELTGVLGEGGFSVVYLAIDHSLERTVAIKEYMPSAIATRQADGTIHPRSPKHEETFRAGLASFINEARLLARFNHPALIHIHRVWEQNGTAYMAMQYCMGRTLRQVAQAEPLLVKEEAWLKTTFTPILDALELLHAENCFHRDISPDNILILQNGAPVLLDFGAARQVIGDMTQALTVILKPGFAPIEQYADDASLQQGSWTDVYGVGAVIYFLLKGKPPVASVARLVKDPMAKLAESDEFEAVSKPFREAIDGALVVHPDQRIRSIAELRGALQLPTFSPDSQFGGLFPMPPAVVPRTMSGDELVLHRLEAEAAVSSPNFSQQLSRPSTYPSETDAVATSDDSSKKRRRFALVAVPFAVAGVAAIALFSGGGKSEKQVTETVVAQSSASNVPDSSAPTLVASAPKLAEAAGDENRRNTASIDGVTMPVGASDSNLPTEHTPTTATRRTGIDSGQTPGDLGAQTSLASSGNAEIRVSAPNTSIAPRSASAANEPATRRPDPPAGISPSVPVNERDRPQTLTLTEKDREKVAKSAQERSMPPPNPIQGSSAPKQAQTVTGPGTETSPAPALKPASAPHQAALVRLSIRPWGQISVDGQPRGISPPLTRLQLAPGPHTVVITNGEFAPVVKQILVPDKGEVVVSHRFGGE